MKAWRAAVTMAAVLAAGSAGAATDDNARPRGGGSGSSSAGERHTSGGSAHSSSSGGSHSSGSSSGSSSSSADDRPPTGAQLRHPRAGTGTGAFHHGYYGGGYYPYYGYYSPYYNGFYGYGWYSPFYWGGYYGYAPGYGYGYGGGAPYGSHGYGSSYRAGQVRVQVQPSETRVYVDGYYAGVADDFDGIFQRLNVSAGGHDLSLRLDGYRTFNVKLYVPLDDTIKLQHKMARGAGEENAGVIGVPQDYSRYDDREPADDRGLPPAGRNGRDDYGDDRDRQADQMGERAVVRLDVQPADASVYVDGAFRGTGRELRQLRLPAGRHRIEVVRPGYRTIERDVDLSPGQTLDVGIDLDRG